MKKSELIDQLGKRKNSLTHYQAETVVNVIFNSMAEALKDGDNIEIRGLGSFAIREHNSYVSRNPKSGDPIEVPVKKSIYFKAGKEIRERVDH